MKDKSRKANNAMNVQKAKAKDQRRINRPKTSEDDLDEIKISTKDGLKKWLPKRLMMAESRYFRSLFDGGFSDSERVELDFDYEDVKDCVQYLETVYIGKPAIVTLEEAVNILPVAAFLEIESVLANLSKLTLKWAGAVDLFDVYRAVRTAYPPMAQPLWNRIVLRFDEIAASGEYLELDDAELSAALRDHRLRVPLEEQAKLVREWLRKHTTNNERVKAAQRELLAVLQLGTEVAEGPTTQSSAGRRMDTVGERMEHMEIRPDPVGDPVEGRSDSVGETSDQDVDRRSRVKSHSNTVGFDAGRSRAAPKGLVVAIGGLDSKGLITSLDHYNAKDNVWTRADAEFDVVGRSQHGSAIAGNNLMLFGGHDGGGYHRSCFGFDINSGVWSKMAKLSVPRGYMASTDFKGSNGGEFVFALGGMNESSHVSICEMFATETKVWTPLPQMLRQRSDFGCAMLGDKLLAVGGFDGQKTRHDCELLDFNAQKWIEPTTTAFLAVPRRGHACVAYDRSVAVVVGGQNGNRRLRSVEMCDIREGQWHTLKSCAIQRSNFGCSLMDDYVYIGGGCTTNNKCTNSCERLDLRNNVWETIAPLPSARSALRFVRLEENCMLFERHDRTEEDPKDSGAEPKPPSGQQLIRSD